MAIFFSFLLLLIASSFYALSRGGSSERAVAAIMMVATTLTPLAAHTGSRVWHDSENGIFAVDCATLGAFVAVMLRSSRFWPIWTTAFQLLSVAAHLGPLFRAQDIAIPYALEEQVWGWIILIHLAIVTRMRQGERKRS